MLRHSIMVAALGLFIVCGSRACTCSQEPPGKCPGLQASDVIFLGTVIGIEAASVDVTATHYRFRVDERFAGADAPEMDIFSGGDDGDCGFRFSRGEQYVVFTHTGADGQLFATICSGTRLASDARALLPQLRAMRKGQRVASVFGVLRRADPPFLALPDDPEDPLPNISLKLRSADDRFETTTDAHGVYSIYDVRAGEYHFSANLPARMELTQKSLPAGLPPFRITSGACFEYNVDALPTGHISGSVVGPNSKPLPVASVELYRAGVYDDARPGLWSFQGAKGVFDFDHVGPGEYILVFNRTNRLDPTSPFPRAFYPGVADLSDARPIKLKDAQQLFNLKLKLPKGYSTRPIKVRLKWPDGKPPGSVTVMAKADQGENSSAERISDDLYQFTLLASTNYTVSAWEDLNPQPASSRRASANCALPARLDVAPVVVSGSDQATKDLTLIFPKPACTVEAEAHKLPAQ